MKSIAAIEIARPRRQVSMLFTDPGNMTKWMHDLAAYEHVGGEPGAVGMRYRMVPKPKTRQRAFISTVTSCTCRSGWRCGWNRGAWMS
jgi:hypothetical protein